MVGKDEIERLREAGAASRAGDPESFWRNPALICENMPKITAGSLRDWIDRHDAWREGWLVEDVSGRHGLPRVAHLNPSAASQTGADATVAS